MEDVRLPTQAAGLSSGCSIEETDVVVTPVKIARLIPTNREIRELFRIFDKDHDNTISGAELGKMLRCMGMDVAEENVDAIMRALDKNCNGKIEYREFKAFLQEEMRRAEDPEEQEKAIRLAFKVFDENEDGVIDESQLKSAMKNLGEPLSDKELEDMLKLADRDEDGKINYEEFIKLWLDSSKKLPGEFKTDV